MSTETELLKEQATKIAESGALGRSRSYGRLLSFLVDCAAGDRTPKELEIAMEVFGRGADFDPSQDSMVRVYAHNLRQKLEHYYATAGRGETPQLVLARGEYRISLVATTRPPSRRMTRPRRSRRRPPRRPSARRGGSRAGVWRQPARRCSCSASRSASS